MGWTLSVSSPLADELIWNFCLAFLANLLKPLSHSFTLYKPLLSLHKHPLPNKHLRIKHPDDKSFFHRSTHVAPVKRSYLSTCNSEMVPIVLGTVLF